MFLSVLDPKALSLNDIVNNMDTLYYIAPKVQSYNEIKTPSGERHFCLADEPKKELGLFPLSQSNLINMKDADYLIVRITNNDIHLLTDNEEPKLVMSDCVSMEPVRQSIKVRQPREILTYKFDGSDEKGTVYVKFRPVNGEIRVNFTDKENAEAYFDYFREQFYRKRSGADFITVTNIYDDLQLVNWDKEGCDIWGWPTLESGPCVHMSDYVRKTNNSKYYGFTLKHPVKIERGE